MGDEMTSGDRLLLSGECSKARRVTDLWVKVEDAGLGWWATVYVGDFELASTLHYGRTRRAAVRRCRREFGAHYLPSKASL